MARSPRLVIVKDRVLDSPEDSSSNSTHFWLNSMSG